MSFEAVPEAVERVATDVIGAAIEVHKHLGPGFIERIYHEALCFELSSRRIAFEHECPVLVNYKGMAILRGAVSWKPVARRPFAPSPALPGVRKARRYFSDNTAFRH